MYIIGNKSFKTIKEVEHFLKRHCDDENADDTIKNVLSALKENTAFYGISLDLYEYTLNAFKICPLKVGGKYKQLDSICTKTDYTIWEVLHIHDGVAFAVSVGGYSKNYKVRTGDKCLFDATTGEKYQDIRLIYRLKEELE